MSLDLSALTGVGPMPSAHERRAALRAALAADRAARAAGRHRRPRRAAGRGRRLRRGLRHGRRPGQRAVRRPRPRPGLARARWSTTSSGCTEATRLPVVVDADTGYGGPLTAMRAVRLLERAGAAAIQLEDQEMPKRCGHFDDHALIPVGHMQAKLAAVVEARDGRRPGDHRPHRRAQRPRHRRGDRPGPRVRRGRRRRAVRRGAAHRRGAGAGRPRAGRRARWSSTSSRVARPRSSSLEEYADLGFGVVLFANYLMRSMMPAGRDALAHLAEHGETGTRADRMATWSERQGLFNLPAFTAAEAAARPARGRRTGDPGPAACETELPDRVGVLVLGSGLAGCAALLAAAEAGQYAVHAGEDVGDRRLDRPAPPASRRSPAPTNRSPRASPTRSSCCARTCSRPGGTSTTSALVDLYCDHQLETYDWLTGHGVRYGEVHAASGQSAPRSHPTDTTAMLVHAAQGGRPARRPPRAGRPRHSGWSARAAASSAWTSTHGGRHPAGAGRRGRASPPAASRRTPSCSTRFAPQMEHALRAGGDGCHGDGLLMAWQLGAGVVDTPYIKGTYGIFHEPHPDEDGTGILAVYKGAIAVNRDGRPVRRRVPAPTRRSATPALAQPGVTTFQVFDARVHGRRPTTRCRSTTSPAASAPGCWSAPTPSSELEAQLRAARGRAGRDRRGLQRRASPRASPTPLGRAHLSGAVGEPVRRWSTPPFYAHPSGTVVLATYCGLTVDTRAAGPRRLRRADRTALRRRRGDRRVPRRRLHDRHVHRQGRDLRPARRRPRRRRGE